MVGPPLRSRTPLLWDLHHQGRTEFLVGAGGSGPPAHTEDSFAISSGPGGAACAGAKPPCRSPRVRSRDHRDRGRHLRAAGDQGGPQGRRTGPEEPRLHPAQGPDRQARRHPVLLESAIKEAELKSGKAEQASPSCPAASRIGSVDTTAGVGPEPIRVGGSVYLAGPYKGAPLSSVVVTPAVAGPFDLGTWWSGRRSSSIPKRRRSPPNPTRSRRILEGFPSRCARSRSTLDRADFTLNPTSCEPMIVTARSPARAGQTATPVEPVPGRRLQQAHVQAEAEGEPEGLDQAERTPGPEGGGHLSQAGRYANIARAQVNLPHSEFLDQGNLEQDLHQTGRCWKASARRGRSTARRRPGRRCSKSRSKDPSTWSAATATSCPPWSPN